MSRKKRDEKAEPEESQEDKEWKNLKTEADRLHKLTKKEEHDFNEFQQQREKLNYFWIVEKKRLEDKRAELRNKDRELQDLEEKHQVEIKIYKQRLKHLLLEHQNEIAQKKTESEMALKLAQDDDRESEFDIKNDRRTLNITSRETELSHDEYLRCLKREQDQKITALRHEFERKASEIQKNFNAKVQLTRDNLDLKRKEEIKSIEDKKLVMIELLMTEHQKQFSDIKNYYNDITHNNLDFIKSQKEEVKELEAEERKDMIKLQEKKAENFRLTAPLKRMNEDLERLRSELEEYNRERNEMRRVKASLQVFEGEENSLVWEHETLLQRYTELKKEQQELYENLRASTFDLKQKSSFRGLILEKKVVAMTRVLEEREAQLNEVLSRANLEPAVLGQVKSRIQDVVQNKNTQARSLQSEIARMNTLQDQFNAAIERKLAEFGLTITELAYVPVMPKVKEAKSVTQSTR